MVTFVLFCPLPLSETFKCGSLVTTNVRSMFTYEQQNVTDRNTTEVNQTDGVELSNVTTTLSDLLENSKNTEIPLEHQVVEEPVFAEMAGMVRIVNGEHCPPGECPWQVRYTLQMYLFLLNFFFFLITQYWLSTYLSHCHSNSNLGIQDSPS